MKKWWSSKKRADPQFVVDKAVDENMAARILEPENHQERQYPQNMWVKLHCVNGWRWRRRRRGIKRGKKKEKKKKKKKNNKKKKNWKRKEKKVEEEEEEEKEEEEEE